MTPKLEKQKAKTRTAEAAIEGSSSLRVTRKKPESLPGPEHPRGLEHTGIQGGPGPTDNPHNDCHVVEHVGNQHGGQPARELRAEQRKKGGADDHRRQHERYRQEGPQCGLAGEIIAGEHVCRRETEGQRENGGEDRLPRAGGKEPAKVRLLRNPAQGRGSLRYQGREPGPQDAHQRVQEKKEQEKNRHRGKEGCPRPARRDAMTESRRGQ